MTAPAAGPKSSPDPIVNVSEMEKVIGAPGIASVAELVTTVSPMKIAQNESTPRVVSDQTDTPSASAPAATTAPT